MVMREMKEGSITVKQVIAITYIKMRQGASVDLSV
jgi:hypothetical protein